MAVSEKFQTKDIVEPQPTASEPVIQDGDITTPELLAVDQFSRDTGIILDDLIEQLQLASERFKAKFEAIQTIKEGVQSQLESAWQQVSSLMRILYEPYTDAETITEHLVEVNEAITQAANLLSGQDEPDGGLSRLNRQLQTQMLEATEVLHARSDQFDQVIIRQEDDAQKDGLVTTTEAAQDALAQAAHVVATTRMLDDTIESIYAGARRVCAVNEEMATKLNQALGLCEKITAQTQEKALSRDIEEFYMMILRPANDYGEELSSTLASLRRFAKDLVDIHDALKNARK